MINVWSWTKQVNWQWYNKLWVNYELLFDMAKLISEFICDFIHFSVYLWFTHIAFIRMMHSAESQHNCWYIFYTIKNKQLQVTHQESCLICRSSNFGYFGPICSGFRKIIRQKFDNYKTAAVGTLCAQLGKVEENVRNDYQCHYKEKQKLFDRSFV